MGGGHPGSGHRNLSGLVPPVTTLPFASSTFEGWSWVEKMLRGQELGRERGAQKAEAYHKELISLIIT